MAVTKVRCKFTLVRIEDSRYSWGAYSAYIFNPQYDDTVPEDQRFAKTTPNGEIRMVIDNPAAQEFFKIGACYYFDAMAVTPEPVEPVSPDTVPDTPSAETAAEPTAAPDTTAAPA